MSIDVLHGEGGKEGGNRKERRGRDRGKRTEGKSLLFSYMCVSVTVVLKGCPEVRPCEKAHNGGHFFSSSLSVRRGVLDIRAQDD